MSTSTNNRTFFVGGNWKCNGGKEVVNKLVSELNQINLPENNRVEIVIAPPSVYLDKIKNEIRKEIAVSAQDVHFQKGAFTGAISPDMLKDLSIPWVIIGHSERRTIFKDTDEIVGKKITAALEAGLSIIPCIGELLEEREANKTNSVIETQLKAVVSNIKDQSAYSKRVVIAYEPVWAIGTGKTASPEQAQEVHQFIRSWLKQHVSEEVSKSVRIIYGGSVSPKNADDLSKQADVDGFLVGGCSLKSNEFADIIAASKQKARL